MDSKPSDRCDDSPSVTTDATGAFAFDAASSFEFFVVMGDRMDTWTLCFDVPGRMSFVWHDWGMWGGPPVERLDCDIGQKAPDDPQQGGFCRATSVSH